MERFCIRQYRGSADILTLNLDDSLTILPISTTAIPEAGSSSMMGIAMVGLLIAARKLRLGSISR
jgi:hypothetical protein